MPDAQAVQTSKRNTVTVACKLPHGFVLQLDDSRKETLPQGGKEIDVYFPIGEQTMITGSNYSHINANLPKGARPVRGVAGHGLTEVDADLWEKWAKQKADWAPLRKGWVFVQPTQDKAEGQAREQRDLKTGLEPLDPNKPAPGIERVTA